MIAWSLVWLLATSSCASDRNAVGPSCPRKRGMLAEINLAALEGADHPVVRDVADGGTD
jgi:hypothetical protein